MSVSLAFAALASSSAAILTPQIAFQNAAPVPAAVAQDAQASGDNSANSVQPTTPATAEAADLDQAIDPSSAPQPEGEGHETGNTIVVSGEAADPMKDPLVEVNEAAFEMSQEVDAAIIEPVAEVYEEGLPKPIRSGLRNFFRNLLEPVNALNFMLQLKPGKAFETLGRFAINSTVGIGGLVDVAKREPFNLPRRRNGFANTLGYYGVGPGPFLVVPLLGPTTLRDALGGALDQAVLPTAVGGIFTSPALGIPAYTITSLEDRIEFDERIAKINASDDPYYAVRETYLCRREADIAALKNRPAPRDCSVEAILGESDPAVVPATSGVNANAATAGETPSEMQQSIAEPAAEPPAIIFVSKEIVQPLPSDYGTPER
ncbi:MlaA family lipoprotein [Erythrobacter sp. W53]|uniref:MlaA family lipoprotein n=1 Tax=Erythrobacter sp. W53 TaxID=3425947 RepID=UPI003D7685F5